MCCGPRQLATKEKKEKKNLSCLATLSGERPAPDGVFFLGGRGKGRSPSPFLCPSPSPPSPVWPPTSSPLPLVLYGSPEATPDRHSHVLHHKLSGYSCSRITEPRHITFFLISKKSSAAILIDMTDSFYGILLSYLGEHCNPT